MGSELKELLASLSGFGSQQWEDIGFFPFLVVMLLSLLSSLFIAFLYTRFYQSRATGSNVQLSFPLLGISITAIFITIQFSLPLSLGLLGALSIVRFRNPIKEPEEIGFIMLVVATSLCIATFNMFFLGIILVVAVCALLIQKLSAPWLKGRADEGMFILKLPLKEYRDKQRAILNLLETRMPKGRIDSISEKAEESIVSFSFIKLDNENLSSLQDELKSLSGEIKTHVYFNRAGGV